MFTVVLNLGRSNSLPFSYQLTGYLNHAAETIHFAGLAVGKFSLRALAQSLARECGPQGIHVAHVVVDGLINTDRVQSMAPDREDHTLLSQQPVTGDSATKHILIIKASETQDKPKVQSLR